MPAEPLVTLSGVHKSFGAFKALSDITLSVAPGEKVVVCGPSGSGKSTMIRCINGLEPYQQGKITVAGRYLTEEEEVGRAVRQEVGMVFQSFNLFPHLTILENCILAPQWVQGKSRDEAVETARRYLKRVYILEQADNYPIQLSGGQQQRVAIARALCMAPRLMLFDEPTSALDPEMVKEVLDVMTDLAREGMTMICVTHEMGFAQAVADRVIFMDRGRIVEQAPPRADCGAVKKARAQEFLAQLLH